ncbi:MULTISPECIES: YhcN/YlaJ family sporulation lipoprotein [unclassified Paenibacillus]|uniref:YhcN/YlaJ family sporulation lipoprotein n=1 Tax=unclassified Paenibacillus TaxID=185978 RepID=UPI001AE2CF31|nr:MULTISPECIES: YhcN/YlaJ family sporulation lipoprotein [unclassified Paenibacillus]MBP1155180.1 YhcN/YlaJ family sporulation lipoprotein [Paenibacillus sp. PvP091]MBP1169436.1 YhcN/YlaJ family sporulation lipoprotein [Paenibacillus sp. PvR098]MBP2440464.1 YhcN/YlaJ family sporulation lipoprotein [Paenibacillus sp. PvP052]
MMKTRPKKLSATGIVLCCLLTLTVGCTNPQQGQGNGQQVQQQAAPNQSFRPMSETEERVEIADQAASKIVSEVPSIKSANVLVTRRNAYVAAVLENSQAQMTQEVENQIAEKVRATDANIQNVYVSVNPDFVGRVNSYVNDVQAGRPISGFVKEFSEMVRRIFPNAR